MMEAFGSFPSGGEFSVADLSIWLCLGAAVVSYLTLGKRRCQSGRIVLLMLMTLCLSYEMLDELYDILTVGVPIFPACLEVFDHAWTWFEASVASTIGALVVFSHASSAESYFEKQCAEQDVVSMEAVLAKRRANNFARRAGFLFIVMAIVEYTMAIVEARLFL